MKTMYATLVLALSPFAALAGENFQCVSTELGSNASMNIDLSSKPAKFSVMNDADPTDYEGDLEIIDGAFSTRYVITAKGGDPKLELVQKQLNNCGRAGCWGDHDNEKVWRAKLGGSSGAAWFSCQ